MPTPRGAALRAPRHETRVAGTEVELLLVAGAVGNVALAVDPQDRAVRVHHREAVVVGRAGLLEERDRDRDAELPGEGGKARDRRMPLGGLRPREELVALFRAEVRPLEELGRQDHGRAPSRRLAHERLHLRDVLLDGSAQRALHGGEGDVLGSAHAGTCCVMQWNAPPPSRSSRAGTESARRPGKSFATPARAASSFGTP